LQFFAQGKDMIGIVTGGNRGFGKVIADMMEHDMGYEVHRPHLTSGFDVRDSGCVKEYFSRFDHIDALVNNAGVSFMKPFILTTNKRLDTTMGVNFYGTWYCTRYALPKMDIGHIVNIASVAGINGFGGLSAYCASKHAVIGLTKALAEELAPKIKVNAIIPPAIKTDMTKGTPDKWLMEPEAFAKGLRYVMEHDMTGKVV